MTRDPPNHVDKTHCNRNGCDKTVTITCPRCDKTQYCSKSCQRVHWKKKHKSRCERTRSIPPPPPEPPIESVKTMQTPRDIRCPRPPRSREIRAVIVDVDDIQFLQFLNSVWNFEDGV